MTRRYVVGRMLRLTLLALLVTLAGYALVCFATLDIKSLQTPPPQTRFIAVQSTTPTFIKSNRAGVGFVSNREVTRKPFAWVLVGLTCVAGAIWALKQVKFGRLAHLRPGS